MKAWYQSKIIWLAIVQTILAVAQLVQNFLEADVYSVEAIVGLVFAIVLFIARKWFTDTAIG